MYQCVSVFVSLCVCVCVCVYVCACTLIIPIRNSLGVLCNNMCPDELQLGQLTSNNWPVWSKIFIVVLVVGLAVLCILIEVAFIVWLCLLERKQDAYLDELEGDEEQPDVLMVKRLGSSLSLSLSLSLSSLILTELSTLITIIDDNDCVQ